MGKADTPQEIQPIQMYNTHTMSLNIKKNNHMKLRNR